MLSLTVNSFSNLFDLIYPIFPFSVLILVYPLLEDTTITESPFLILSTVFEIKFVEDFTATSDVTIAFFCSFSKESIVTTFVFSILEISIS